MATPTLLHQDGCLMDACKSAPSDAGSIRWLAKTELALGVQGGVGQAQT